MMFDPYTFISSLQDARTRREERKAEAIRRGDQLSADAYEREISLLVVIMAAADAATKEST